MDYHIILHNIWLLERIDTWSIFCFLLHRGRLSWIIATRILLPECPLLQLTLSSFTLLDIRAENAENRKTVMHKRLCFYERVSTIVYALSKYRAYAKRRKV